MLRKVKIKGKWQYYDEKGRITEYEYILRTEAREEPVLEEEEVEDIKEDEIEDTVDKELRLLEENTHTGVDSFNIYPIPGNTSFVVYYVMSGDNIKQMSGSIPVSNLGYHLDNYPIYISKR